MAVESPLTPLGLALGDRSLPDSSGVNHPLRQVGAAATLIAFVCNHCPYVRHIETALGDLVRSHTEKGLMALAVVSNDLVEYPDDDIEGMEAQLVRANWDFPYLIDRDQSLALELGAVCTPDFFLFDSGFHLVYRGAFDDSSPKNGNPVTGELLKTAIELTLGGKQVPTPHRSATGCGIKWSPGNEPPAA
tara:strand:- start:183 stop:752 length:570 start_codon:yes stop_codon:yes gene_type:complete